MNKRTTTFSVAAVLAASVLALQAPVAGAADNDKAAQSSGVPGVEMNVGNNASDRGVPGVEMNVGRDGDQNNINSDTRTLGAGADQGTADQSNMNADTSLDRPARADRG